MVLDLVDHGLVLERGAVAGEVDGLRRIGKELHLSAGVVVALLERCEGGGRLPFEAEGAADLGPVDFEGCASLVGKVVSDAIEGFV